MSNTEIKTLKDGESVWVERFAAQCYATHYYFLRLSKVMRNKKGKQFLKPLESTAYGRRGNGTLSKNMPELQPAKFEHQTSCYECMVAVNEPYFSP